jgi:hypothetical protein
MLYNLSVERVSLSNLTITILKYKLQEIKFLVFFQGALIQAQRSYIPTCALQLRVYKLW